MCPSLQSKPFALSTSPESVAGMCLKFSQSDSLSCNCESEVSDMGSHGCLEVIFTAALDQLCLLLTSRTPLVSANVLTLGFQSSGVPVTLLIYSLFGLRLRDIFCKLQSRTLADTNCVNHLK